MSQPIEIFCCVAESDRPFLEKLSIQLALQQQQGIIKLWEKSQISPGAIADEEIQHHLTSARIFLLLISADFLADSYCYDLVLKAALERHTRGEALTIPVIVRPANWQAADGRLKRIQVLPRNGQPISERSDQANALLEVGKEIHTIIEGLVAPPMRPDSGVEDKPYEEISSTQTGSELNPLLFPDGEKISPPPAGNKWKISVTLVLAALIILGGGVAFALYVNHPTPTTTTVLTPTSTLSTPTQPPLKWTFPTGDKVYSSPTVQSGVLYIGSDKVYALDASTGQQKWTFPTGASISYSSPTVVNGVLYVGSTDDNVYAIDANTGQKIWAFSTGAAVESSPTVVNGVLYVGSDDDHAYAIDASTGQQKWAFSTGGWVFSRSVVVNGVLYISSGDSWVYALDASTGQKIWAFPTGGVVNSSPTVVNGVLYVGSNDHKVYAIDASTGQKIWAFPTGKEVYSSPTVVNGVLYIGSLDGKVYALNANTGQQKWAFPTGIGVASSPKVIDGVLYVASGDGKVYALDASTGQQKWTFPTGASISYSSPTVVNGVLYIGTYDGKVYALMLPA